MVGFMPIFLKLVKCLLAAFLGNYPKHLVSTKKTGTSGVPALVYYLLPFEPLDPLEP